MPALFNTRPIFEAASLRAASEAVNTDIPVICAWPLSGQYGPGSRILYYILVAACVLARKSEWLRNACLAAALIFPAVAALHGITLAALHVDGAIDMDIFGAFQLCTIGILAVPVTTRLSTTYFYDPGRNVIFVWTGLVLAGLLSLTVEFYRSNPMASCTAENLGPEGQFPYGVPCGLSYCVEVSGPQSPMRQGATSEIYVLPVPSYLTFNTATLISAACCIPAILYLISTWIKILELNWKSRFGTGPLENTIEGTNGATIGGMLRINSVIQSFLGVLEILLFGAAVVAILIIGELNFWSPQLVYETEYMSSIGQWAPVAGTVIAVVGSLYALFMTNATDAEDEGTAITPGKHHCNCAHHSPDHSVRRSPSIMYATSTHSSGSGHGHPPLRDGLNIDLGGHESRRTSTLHRASTIEDTDVDGLALQRTRTSDAGRRRAAKFLNSLADQLGTAAHDRFDDSDFKHGKAVNFPEIPGEAGRNDRLNEIREAYNPPRDLHGSITPELRSQRSRASSFHSSYLSGALPDPTAAAHGDTSLDDDRPSVSMSRVKSHDFIQSKPRSSTMPTDKTPRSSLEHDARIPRPLKEMGKAKRSNTLEVPSIEHSLHVRSSLHAVASSSVVISHHGRADTPAIVLSPDIDDSDDFIHNTASDSLKVVPKR